MPKKCKDCPDEKITINDELFDWMRTYNFSKLWIVVKAKSLEEAEKIVKEMTEEDYENKSI